MKKISPENPYTHLKIKKTVKTSLDELEKRLAKESGRHLTHSEVVARLLSHEPKLDVKKLVQDASLASAFPNTAKWHYMLEALLTNDDHMIVEGVKNYLARTLFTLVAGDRKFTLPDLLAVIKTWFRGGYGPAHLQVDVESWNNSEQQSSEKANQKRRA
jgi:hypothetical protein